VLFRSIPAPSSFLIFQDRSQYPIPVHAICISLPPFLTFRTTCHRQLDFLKGLESSVFRGRLSRLNALPTFFELVIAGWAGIPGLGCFASSRPTTMNPPSIGRSRLVHVPFLPVPEPGHFVRSPPCDLCASLLVIQSYAVFIRYPIVIFDFFDSPRSHYKDPQHPPRRATGFCSDPHSLQGRFY